MNGQYGAGSVKVNWNTIDLSTGWGTDTFLSIEHTGAYCELIIGAGGQGTPVQLADRSAKITMTFTQTAPVNKDLAKAAALQAQIGAAIPVAPFVVEDQLGHTTNFVAFNAILTEGSNQTFSKSAGEKTWVWMAESYFDTEDPVTFQSTISNWIKNYS